jgi:peptidoglycan/LPS O-acetylase OafA/YrhL
VPVDLARRHLRLGWWSLLVFLSLGILLEALHGFKIGFYMDLANATRRHVWTLAHAHGTLLALVNLAFAATLRLFCDGREPWLGLASACLVGATLLLPGGFFLGGVVIYAGDPGLGVLLVPIGAGLLLLAVLQTARGLSAARSTRDGER